MYDQTFSDAESEFDGCGTEYVQVHGTVALTYASYGRHGCRAGGGGGGGPSHVRVVGCYGFYNGRALRHRAGWFLSFVAY